MSDEPINIEIIDKIDPQIAIKIREIATAARNGQTEINKLQASVNSLGASNRKAVSDTDALAKSNTKLLQSIELQAATFGKAKSEVLAHKAALAGVTNEASPFIAKIAAAEGAVHKFNLANAGSVRELLVLAREMGRGDYSRMAGSMTILAQRSGLLDMILSPLGLTIVGVTAVLGTFAAAVITADLAISRLNNALIVTNQYSGLTAAEFENSAQRIALSSNTSFGEVRKTLLGIVDSGKFTSGAVKVLAQDIEELAHRTGQSTEKISKYFDKAAESPTKFAKEFLDQYHSMDAAFIEHIRKLENEGEKERATIELLIEIHKELGKEGPRQISFLELEWNAFGHTLDNIWVKLQRIARADSPGGRTASRSLERVDDEIGSETAKANALRRQGYTNSSPAVLFINKHIVALGEEAKQIREVVTWQNEQTAAQTAGATKQKEIADANEKLATTYSRGADNLKRFTEAVKDFKKANDLASPEVKRSPHEVQLEIERLRREYMPNSYKAGNKAEREAESQAAAIAKVNAKIGEETALYGLLGDAREVQKEFDKVSIELFTKKIYLYDQESGKLTKLGQQIYGNIVAAKEKAGVDKQEQKLYKEIVEPLEDYNDKLKANEDLLKRGVITQARKTAEDAAATRAYKDATDPLAAENRQLDEQLRLLNLFGPARALEAKLEQTRQQLLVKGFPIDDIAIAKLAYKLTLLERENTLNGLRDQTRTEGVSAADSAVSGVLQKDNYVARRQASLARIRELEKAGVVDHAQAERAKAQIDEQYQRSRLANTSEFLNTLATLSSSKNKQLKAIGKAAAMAQATIDGVLAVQKALSAYPPPINFAMAAAVGVVAAVNVSKIAGMRDGGPVRGPGGPKDDKVLRWLSDGEYVVNAHATAQNRALLDAINQGQSVGMGYASGGYVSTTSNSASYSSASHSSGPVFNFQGANFGGADAQDIEKRFRRVFEEEYGPAILAQADSNSRSNVQALARQRLNGGSR